MFAYRLMAIVSNSPDSLRIFKCLLRVKRKQLALSTILVRYFPFRKVLILIF